MIRLFFSLVLVVGSASAHAQLWFEDFEGEGNGATTGTAAGTAATTWSANTPGGTFARGNLFRNSFLINNTGSEGVWQTQDIDISSAGYAVIDITLGSAGFGFDAGDYIRCYYVLDNSGVEVLFAESSGSFLSSVTNASAIVSANTLKLVIRANDNSFFGAIDFENVTVTAAPVLYSRKSGTWTDVTGGFGGTGTWSTTRGGGACGCVPLNGMVAIIQNGHTVTLPTSQTAVGGVGTPNLAPGGIDVENGGILQFTTNNVTLGIQAGMLRVRAGGRINSNGGGVSAETISFNGNVGGASFRIDGLVVCEVLAITTPNFHMVSGAGTLLIQDDIRIMSDNASLRNDMTSTIAVTDRIHFSNGVSNSIFENNGSITCRTLYFEETNDQFVNNGTVTIGDIFCAANTDDNNVFDNNGVATLTNTTTSIDVNAANLIIRNSGTINQLGDFADLVNGDDFVNEATGTWNWEKNANTVHANFSSAMNCTAAGNTFVYNGTADQNIGAPTGGYSNLILNTGGTKTAGATLDVNRDLTITGVTLATGTAAIDVEGSVFMTGAANVTGSGQVDVNTNINMANASTWNGTGVANVVGSINLSNTAQWAGTNTANISGNLNFSDTPTWTGNGAVNIAGTLNLTGGTFSGNGAIDVNTNIVISGTGELNGNGNVNIRGTWSAASASSFSETGRLVTFDGTTQSITNSSGAEAFVSMRLNMGANANTVTLNNTDITVSNVLTLTRGRLSLNGNSLTVTNGATGAITGGATASYILSETTSAPYSRIIWNIGANNGIYTFPFGNSAGSYVPYVLNKTAGTAAGGSVTAATYATASNNLPYPATVPHVNNAAGVDRSTLVVDRWWIISQSGYSPLTAAQTLTFSAAEASLVTTPPNRTAQRWDGTNWIAGVGSSTSTSFPVPSSSLNPTSIWVVASNNAVLPVELVDFSAQLKNHEVVVSWKTASEANNDFFAVERTQDLEQFSVLTQIAGQGSSPSGQSYSFIDDRPLYGRSYYRLRQTDFDGTTSFSRIEVVDYAGPEFAVIHTYPSPGNGKTLQIEGLGLDGLTELSVEIVDAKGVVVWRGVLPVTTPGSLKQELVFANPLSPGLYIVKAGPTRLLTRKIVVK